MEYQFENAETAKVFITKELGKSGIVGPALVTAKCSQIAGSIPTDLRDDFPEDDIWAAAEYFETWGKSQNGKGDKDPDPNKKQEVTTEKKAKTTLVYVEPIIPAGAKDAIKEALEATKPLRVRNTAQVMINDIFIKNPLPGEYLKGVMVVPKTTEALLNEYESKLVETDENRAAFNEVKEAVVNSKEVPAFVNEYAHTLLGVELSGLEKTDSGVTESGSKIVSMAELLGFVFSKTMGQLGTVISRINVGAKLRELTPVRVNKDRTLTESNIGKPGLTIVGGLQAIKDGNYTVAYEQSEEEPTIKKSISIGKTFIIKTDDTNQKGEPVYKNIRLKGTWSEHPNFVPKPEFAEKFPMNDKSVLSNVITNEIEADRLKVLTSYCVAAIESNLVVDNMILENEFKVLIEDIAKKSSEVKNKEEEGIDD